VDDGLHNGTSYVYAVIACYADGQDARKLLRSPGVEVTATPVALPSAISDLRVGRDGRNMTLTWTQPRSGSIQIRRSRHIARVASGTVMPLAEADRFGALVPISGRGTTQVSLDSQGRVFFVPLSVVSQTAVVGTPVEVVVIDEVAKLEAYRRGTSIHLIWTW